jgi:hypothetical protein
MSSAKEKELKNILVWIDKTLTNGIFNDAFISQFQKNNISIIVENLPIKNSIMWSAMESDSPDNEKQHPYIVIIPEMNYFNSLIEDYNENKTSNNNLLNDYIKEIKMKSNANDVKFLIPNIKKTPTTTKKKSNKLDINKEDIDVASIYLQFNHNTSIKYYDSNEEIVEFINQITKAIAEEAIRGTLVVSEFMLADCSSEKQSKLGKNGEGLLSVWTNMLEKFQFISKDQACAIVAKYPSFYLLKDAYKSLSEKEGKLLLADIQVRRGAGVLANVRRIGPELSKKLYKFFTSTDPNEIIANDD